MACLHRLKGWQQQQHLKALLTYLVPGLRQLGSSDMSVSLCDLCMWFVQHGGVKGPRLVTWRLDAPNEHVLREKDPEESYVAFYD